MTGQYAWGLYTAYIVAVICDIFIVGTLCYYLHRRRTGMKRYLHSIDPGLFTNNAFRTDDTLNILMLYCINSGALSCAVHIVNLIMVRALSFCPNMKAGLKKEQYVTMSENFIYIAVHMTTAEGINSYSRNDT